MATADLGGLGANEGPPVFQVWRGMRSNLAAVFFPRAVPWLAVLGLLLFKPNRCRQAWWVWLPLLAIAGLGLGAGKYAWASDTEMRETFQSMVMALGFGWAGLLLLATSAAWPRRLGRFGCLLFGLSIVALPGLAFSRNWGQGMFSDLTDLVSGVLLQFLVFGLAAALSLAGWSVRRRFTVPRLLGRCALWLIVVWLVLAIPCATLNALGRGEALPGVLVTVGMASLVSLVVALPFLALAAANSLYRQRLQQLVVPPEPAW